jgi:RNA polymerase sigma-70 factor (ECF subfamily)
LAPVVRDGGGFEAIYGEHFGFVWRCLRGLGVQEASLDDAAQDVFVIVHRKLCDFRGDSTLRTWLYGIVRNVAMNQRRSVYRRGPTEELGPDVPAHGPRPDEHAQDREAADFVRGFLERTSQKKRELFVLAILEQMSIPEVAEALSIPLNTAYTRLRDVRSEFRKAMQQVRQEGGAS